MALGALWALLQPWVVMCHRVGYKAAGFELLQLPSEERKGGHVTAPHISPPAQGHPYCGQSALPQISPNPWVSVMPLLTVTSLEWVQGLGESVFPEGWHERCRHSMENTKSLDLAWK